MSDSPDNARINQLISEKRYEEAKIILRQSTDPAAQKWLARLEELYPPPRKESVSTSNSDYGSYGLGTSSYGHVTSSGGGSAYRFPPQYERGGCLTAFLLFVAGVNVIGTLFLLSPLTVILCIFVVSCVWGIWNQQKWGYFGLMVAYVLNILASVFLLHNISPAIGAIIGMTIAFALINPQLEQFS